MIRKAYMGVSILLLFVCEMRGHFKDDKRETFLIALKNNIEIKYLLVN